MTFGGTGKNGNNGNGGNGAAVTIRFLNTTGSGPSITSAVNGGAGGSHGGNHGIPGSGGNALHNV